MAEVLILDSEAVNALANPGQRSATTLRARAITAVAVASKAVVLIPAPVLVEVCRGGARDAAVNRLIGSGVEVVPLTRKESQRAGALLAIAGLDSTNAVDAFVVAAAEARGGALIATHDPADLETLAAHATGVRVLVI